MLSPQHTNLDHRTALLALLSAFLWLASAKQQAFMDSNTWKFISQKLAESLFPIFHGCFPVKLPSNVTPSPRPTPVWYEFTLHPNTCRSTSRINLLFCTDDSHPRQRLFPRVLVLLFGRHCSVLFYLSNLCTGISNSQANFLSRG